MEKGQEFVGERERERHFPTSETAAVVEVVAVEHGIEVVVVDIGIDVVVGGGTLKKLQKFHL